MSFYGSISDRSRTDLKFDKIYPNRFLMDQSAAKDDIFVGRYVLVNYEGGYDNLITPTVDANGEEINISNCYCIDKNGNYFITNGFKFSDDDIETEEEILFDIDNDKALIIPEGNLFTNFNDEVIYVKVNPVGNEDNIELKFTSVVNKEAYDSYLERIGNYRKVQAIEEYFKNTPEAVEASKEEGFNRDEYLTEHCPKLLEIPKYYSLPDFYIKDNIVIPIVDNTNKEFYKQQIFLVSTDVTHASFGIEDNYDVKSYIILEIKKNHMFDISKSDKVFIWVANAENYFYGGDFKDVENISFNIDEFIYDNKRGYDSTVWEKIYKDGKYEYIKIADLNSLVPSFKIEMNAPTASPKTPIVEPYGDNLNYKISWQPSWGFRVKSAKVVEMPKMTPEGILFKDDENSKVVSSTTNENWTNGDNSPRSDVKTRWTTEIFSPTQKTFVKKYYNFVNGSWDDEVGNLSDYNIPAAIYFNKKGFNIEKSIYSTGANTPPDFNSTYLTSNYIKVEPTGNSGIVYTENGHDLVLPDTQELSMMLPVLGDSVAYLWDTIYGRDRNLDISWKDGSLYDPIREGLRMAPSSYSEEDGIKAYEIGHLSYNKPDLETLAGCINTVHDLIGMIVIEEDDVATMDLSEHGENFIYYDKTSKQYYQKQYNKVLSTEDTSLNLFEPINTSNFKNFDDLREEKFYYKVDTSFTYNDDNGVTKPLYNYIYDPIQKQSDREYVGISAKEVNVEEEYGFPYEPNKYFIKTGTLLDKDWLLTNYENHTFIPPIIDESGSKKGIYYKVTLKNCYTETLTNNDKVKAKVDKLHSMYIPYYYYYQIPIFDNGRELIGKKYILDTSMNGYQYPKVLPGYETWWTDEANAPEGYLEEYYGKRPKYFRPKVTKDADGNPLTVSAKVTLKQVYSGEYERNLDNLIVGPTSLNFYTKNGEDDYKKVSGTLLTQAVDEGKTIYIDVIQAINQEVLEFDESEDNYYIFNFDYKYETDKIYYRKGNSKDGYYTRVDSFEHAQELIESGDETLEFFKEEEAEPILLYEDVGHLYYLTDGKSDFPLSYKLNTTNFDGIKKYYEVEEKEEKITFFEKGIYYQQLEDGIYKLVENFDDFSIGDTLYKKNDLVVVKDTKGIFKPGSIWNNKITNIPDNITLGTTKDEYQMVPLKGFARNINTILGLIVKINNILKESDEYCRDRTTVQGTLNYLNDIIDKIDELYDNELVFTDQFGRIHAPHNSTKNNDWINLNINTTGDMYLEATHNVAKIENTEINFEEIDEIELSPTTSSPADSISFIVPSSYYDEKGHMYGIKKTKYTIPIQSILDEVANELISRIELLEQKALRYYPQAVVGEDANNVFYEDEDEVINDISEEDTING